MFFFKEAAKIIGLPNRKKRLEIPTIENGQWEYGVQEHHAKRAGKHYDLRLGDKKNKVAYSWAIRHWPKPGEKRLAIRQPDHSIPYMDWSGTIPEGYGAGKVKLTQRGQATITSASPKKIKIIIGKKSLTLINTGGDNWLLVHEG